MKYCVNCGNELKDDMLFCEKCGTKVEKESKKINGMDVEKIKNLFQHISKKAYIAAAAVIVILVAIVIVVANNSKKINVYDYVDVEFNGYNSVGTASVNVDTEKLVVEILKKNKIKTQSIDDLSASNYNKAQKILKNINDSKMFSYELDKKEKLSNGDEIKIKFNIDKNILKEWNVKLIAKDKKYSVENLKDIEKINPFDYINVIYTGTSPNAYATVKTKPNANEFVRGLRFDIDKNKVALGDKINVTIDIDNDKAALSGYQIVQMSNEYTCEYVDAYLSDINSVVPADMTKLQKNATDKIESYIASFSSSYNVKCENLKYEGSYVLMGKSLNSNVVYLIYSGTVSAEPARRNAVEPTKVYFPVYMSDVIISSNKKIKTDIYCNIKGSTSLGSITIHGYTDGYEMYKEIITASKNNYTAQVSGDISEFGK